MASIPSQSSSSTAPILSHHDPHDMNLHQYYNYPPVHRPPPAHVNHTKRLSEAQRSETIRVQTSISSAGSGSSGSLGMKQYPSPQTYWHASNAEQGYMSNGQARSSRPQSINKYGAHSPSRQEMVEDNSAVLRYIQERQSIEEEEEEEDHAIWILFWLSFLDPIHSFINTVYTILVVFTLTLASPIRICHSQSSYGDQLIRILAPLFRNHLDMLYAPSVEDAYTFDFKPLNLVLINLSSPFLSIGVMLAAWVAAAFWLFTTIMGNPDGTEKGDDGRDAVLSVRNWWERYLLKAVKQLDGR